MPSINRVGVATDRRGKASCGKAAARSRSEGIAAPEAAVRPGREDGAGAEDMAVGNWMISVSRLCLFSPFKAEIDARLCCASLAFCAADSQLVEILPLGGDCGERPRSGVYNPGGVGGFFFFFCSLALVVGNEVKTGLGLVLNADNLQRPDDTFFLLLVMDLNR